MNRLYSAETLSDIVDSLKSITAMTNADERIPKPPISPISSHSVNESPIGATTPVKATMTHTALCCCDRQLLADDAAPASTSHHATPPKHNAAGVGIEEYQIHKDNERKRDKAKRFMKEKSPRIAAAAATIALFIFNIVSNCF